MLHQPKKFKLTNGEEFKIKVLNWVKRFNIFCFLDNCGYASPIGFRCLLAAGAKEITHPPHFEAVDAQLQQHPSWWFGHFNYEFNEVQSSNKPEYTRFPKSVWFVPEILIEIHENSVNILESNIDADTLMHEILETRSDIQTPFSTSRYAHSITRNEYLLQIQTILKHIQRGDCYELNYCQAFTAVTNADPLQLFSALNKISPNPFSAFYRYQDMYCICASPERFIKKDGNNIISQPIKGTAPRGRTPEEDANNYEALQHSEKDKSENVMVVDLVRNDLSRVCVAGSVTVPELFSIKSYPGVHQMVSTVKGTLKPGVTPGNVLEATFPMGSMTGAPKHRVMELTQMYEAQQRGLFSGTIGYFTPEGDFDFNVVIRSMFLNNATGEISFLSGGGITHNSIPEKEYEESILKTKAIRTVLKLAD